MTARRRDLERALGALLADHVREIAALLLARGRGVERGRRKGPVAPPGHELAQRPWRAHAAGAHETGLAHIHRRYDEPASVPRRSNVSGARPHASDTATRSVAVCPTPRV